MFGDKQAEWQAGKLSVAIEFTSANETMSIRETSSSTNDTVETADYITLGNQYYAQMSLAKRMTIITLQPRELAA